MEEGYEFYKPLYRLQTKRQIKKLLGEQKGGGNSIKRYYGKIDGIEVMITHSSKESCKLFVKRNCMEKEEEVDKMYNNLLDRLIRK